MGQPIVTTRGLRSASQASASVSNVQWAVAAGTVDVITAAFDTALTELTDGLCVAIRTSGPNLTTTPSFNPDGLGAHTIVKNYGVALEPGDLPDEAFLRYLAASTVWVLVNPNAHVRVPSVNWADAGGTVDAITAIFTPTTGALVNGQIVGVRATGANTSTAPTFAPDSLTARIIYKLGKQALNVGDIFGNDHELWLRYHVDTVPWWELLNPALAYDITNGNSFKRLTADGATFADDTNAHGVGLKVTLAVGDHEFRGRIHTTRTAGANSHTTSLLFNTTGTMTVKGRAVSRGGDANALAALSGLATDVLTAQVVKAASTSLTEDVDLFIEGVITVTVAGDFEPQLQYSVAPGGVTTPKAGSYLSTTKRTNPQGTWT